MHTFGCEYVKILDELRRKLDSKARKLYFVGYNEQSKAFRLLDKKTNKIIISRDVIFLDDKQKQEEDEKEESEESEADLKVVRKKEHITTEKEIQAGKEKGPTEEPNIIEHRGNQNERIRIFPPLSFNEFAGMTTHEDDEPNTINEALTGRDKLNNN